MAAAHIFAIGRISKGHTSLRMAPHTPDAASQLEAYLEGSLGKPGLADYVPMAPHDPTCTPDWQCFVEYAEADDYADYLEEIEWIRHGC